jgi:hypothetical protein
MQPYAVDSRFPQIQKLDKGSCPKMGDVPFKILKRFN